MGLIEYDGLPSTPDIIFAILQVYIAFEKSHSPYIACLPFDYVIDFIWRLSHISPGPCIWPATNVRPPERKSNLSVKGNLKYFLFRPVYSEL